MRQGMGRRAVLGAAAWALAGLLAACRGPEGETIFQPARTPTPVGVTPTAAGTGDVPTPVAASPVGTVIPTPRKGDPVPDFLRMLAFVPNDQDASGGLRAFLDRWQGTLSFANLGAVKHLYGYDAIQSYADLQARNIAVADYANATGGCYLSAFPGAEYGAGQYRDAFGFDVYQVDREISAGQPPDYFSRMEGAFDTDAIAAKLQAGGYTAASQNGATFSTVRGDGELNLQDPRGRLALGRMNRVAFDKERILAAPKTEIIAAALDAEAKKRRALDANPTLRALATTLGGVTSVVTIPPGVANLPEAGLRPEVLVEITRGWGTLHVPELIAMGYTDAGNNARTMHVALVYTTPSDAAADAPELVKRLTGYRLLSSQQPLLPTYATGVASRTATSNGKGILVADLALVPKPALSRFWIDLFTRRDTLFLVPQPFTGNPASSAMVGTPPAGAGTSTP